MNIPGLPEKEDWQVVLEYLYENQIWANPEKIGGWSSPEETTSFTKFTKIYEDLALDADSIDDQLKYLKEIGLAESENRPEPSLHGLTSEGARMAYQLKTERQRSKMNIMLLILTALLAAPLLVDFLMLFVDYLKYIAQFLP